MHHEGAKQRSETLTLALEPSILLAIAIICRVDDQAIA
jgi:hypothetical protein